MADLEWGITRNFRELTQNFRVITRNFRELTRNFRELTRNFRVITRNFRELTRNFRVITRNFRELTRKLYYLNVYNIHQSHFIYDVEVLWSEVNRNEEELVDYCTLLNLEVNMKKEH